MNKLGTSRNEDITSEGRIKAALEVIGRYGGIDGGHHKQWVLDQAVRLLTGCPTTQKCAIDRYGNKNTYDSLDTCDEYKAWVKEWTDGEDGPNSYEWDEGIAP